MPDDWLLVSNRSIDTTMLIKLKEDTNLAKPDYAAPNHGVSDPVAPEPNPDQTLTAEQQAALAQGGENPGFSLGGANDPLAEGEPTQTVPEDNDILEFDSVDEMPEFEDYDELDTQDAVLDDTGVIEPVIYEDDPVEDPELGIMPTAELPMTEPVVQVEADEDDIYVSNAELDGGVEPIVVTEAFHLPENRSIVVGRGDQIFLIGHAMNEKTPKFAESAFKRAFRSLVESKNIQGKLSFRKSEGLKKVAIVERSCLVEVAKDWRLPGTDTVFEEHDILQIVSMKPITEKRMKEGGEGSGNLDNFGDKQAEPFSKKEADDYVLPESEDDPNETAEEKKAKQEALIAYKRWKEAKNRRVAEADKNEPAEPENKEPETDPDEKKKQQEAFLRKNGIYF